MNFIIALIVAFAFLLICLAVTMLFAYLCEGISDRIADRRERRKIAEIVKRNKE